MGPLVRSAFGRMGGKRAVAFRTRPGTIAANPLVDRPSGVVMSKPVLIRGSLANWPFVLLNILGFFALAFAAWAGVAQLTGWAIILGISGLSLLILSPILRWKQRRNRQWVEDLSDRFKVIDFLGERTFRDDQVLSSALLFKNNYSNGVYKSQTRTFRVWLTSPEPQPELVQMTNTMADGDNDPLAKMINRINDRLYEQAKQDLASGHSVLGECWVLQGSNLTLREKQLSYDCPLADLTAIEVLENKVCLWRKGRDDAFIRIPAQTANAYLLHRLVNENLSQRSDKTEKVVSTGQLGRILFERKPAAYWPGFHLVCALGFIVIGALIIVSLKMDKQLGMVGLGMIACGGLFLFLMVYTRKKLFRCHEYGVHQRGVTIGERSLRYDDVASFTYSATRHYHNGAYVGTNVVMTFEPVPEQKGNRINYSATVHNQDAGLDELRDQISRIIAGRMAIRASKGEVVPWTNKLTYRPEGLEYRPTGFLGTRKEPITIPFSSISGWKLDAGYFYLWQSGKKKPTVTESVGDANFFPGFFLLEMLGSDSVGEGPLEVEAVDEDDA